MRTGEGMRDLYKVLGVADSATPEQIKKAYRDLAKQFHPDRNAGDKEKESRFKEISAAYHVLGDAERKRKYDMMRNMPQGFGGMGGGGGGGPGGMPFDVEELFRGFAGFGGGGGRGGAGAPNIDDIFGDLFGAGRARGGGGPRVVYSSGGGRPRPAPPQRPAEERLTSPAGVEFIRRGDDLHVDVPITIEEAVIGAKIRVPTWTGGVTMSVPAGTSSGTKMRLKGKGHEGRGDQYAVIQITVPKEIDDDARRLIQEFSRKAPVTPKR